MMGMSEGRTEEFDILRVDQDDTVFTGERLVINKQVKQHLHKVMDEHLARYELACGYAKGRNVLDAACGTGYGTRMLKDCGACKAVGVDISRESIDNANITYRTENVEFIFGDVNSLPFVDGSFDMAVSFETIEHVMDGARLIKEASRVLSENGLFIVSTPNRNVTNPGIYVEERPLNRYHLYEYSLTEFIGALLKYFDIVEIYGQAFVDDCQTFAVKIVRQARGMDADYVPEENKTVPEHFLVPLSEIKNANPTYIVAVCRKKLS